MVPATNVPERRFRKHPESCLLFGFICSFSSGRSIGVDINYLLKGSYEGRVICIELSFQRRSSQALKQSHFRGRTFLLTNKDHMRGGR